MRVAIVLLALWVWPATLGPRCLAESRRLDPESAFSAIAGLLQPGDEVVLAPGRHRPLRLENLHGTPTQPITVRGEGMDRPGLVAAGAHGIEVVGCSHLLIQDVVVHSATIVGVLVQADASATPPRESAGIVLRRVAVLGLDESPSTGVRVASGRDVRLEQCRIERCLVAGLDLDGARAPRIADLVVAGTRTPGRCAILVRGGTEDAHIANAAIVGGMRCGALLGAEVAADAGAAQAPLPDAAAPPTGGAAGPSASPPAPLNFTTTAAPVRGVRFDQCSFGRCESALVVGNVAGALVQRCTFYFPKGPFVVVVDGAPAARVESPLVLRGNLFAWLPNQMSRLATLPDGFDARSLVLEANLWWSEDFQLRRTEYGPFPGTEAAAQVTDIDPRIDREGRAANEAAAGFGAG